jgi:hypothetical protein
VGDELEQLAAKKRAASGKSTGAERRARAEAARARGGGHDAMVRRAFTPSWALMILALIATLGLTGGVIALTLQLLEPPEDSSELVVGILGALGLVGASLAMRGVHSMNVRAQLAWLASLPFQFDDAHYLRLLSKRHGMVKIVVQVTPERPLSEGDARLVADAVDGALEKVLVRWRRDGTLEIKSRAINTTEMVLSNEDVGRTDSKMFPDNSGCHRWVRRCVDRALLPVHARFPIASVAIDFA